MPETVKFALEWDPVGEHWLETGTDRGVLYPVKSDGTYDAGVAWTGLRSFDENPEGAEPQDFWADNIKYASLMSAEQYKYTIGCYTFPPEWGVCNGYGAPTKGVNLGQQTRKAFGFTCRTLLANEQGTDEDKNYVIHIIYNSLASPSQKSYETVNDSPAAVEISYDCTSTPVNCDGYKPVSKIEIDSRYVDAKKLAALEAILYGTPAEGQTAAVPARLPDPNEIMALFA